MRRDLRALLSPTSIALVGASDDPARIAGRPLNFLLRSSYQGAIRVVNPRYENVQGVPCAPSVAALDIVPDLAIISLPAAAVVAALRDCAAAGVGCAIVFAGGFAESGEAGREMQDEIRRIARQSGMRVLGPNTVGAADFERQVLASFSMAVDEWQQRTVESTRQRLGLAVVSQSGALGNYLLTQALDAGLRVTHWIATGNEADIEFAEVLESLVGRPGVDAVLGYLEGARDGPRLIAALERARANGVPVVLVKAGATERAARAVRSHTDALAGDDAVYDAVFARTGVHRVHRVEDLLELARVFSVQRTVRGPRTLLVSISGGVAVLMAEAAEAQGLALPDLSASAGDRLRALLPFMAPANPLDLTGQVSQDPALLRQSLEIVVADTGADTVITFIGRIARAPAALAGYVDAIEHLRALHPGVTFMTVGMFDEQGAERVARTGLVFSDPSRAVEAAGALARSAEVFRGERRPAPADDSLRMPRPTEPLDEAAGLALLEALGIPVPLHKVAASEDEVLAAAREIPGPWVLKILSAGLAHKSEAGGVYLDLRDDDALRRAWRSVEAAHGSLRTDGPARALLMPMQTGFVETFLGVRIDDVFGAMVVVGMGGVFAEIVADTVVRPAPVDVDEAMEMIAGLKAAALFGAVRGLEPCEPAELARAVARLSQWAHANAGWLRSVEINPFALARGGGGSAALDFSLQMRDRD